MKCADCGYFERKRSPDEWFKLDSKDVCFLCKEIRRQVTLTPEAKEAAGKEYDQLNKRRHQLLNKHFLKTISTEEAVELAKVTLRMEELDFVIHPLNWELFRNMRLQSQNTQRSLNSLCRLLDKAEKR